MPSVSHSARVSGEKIVDETVLQIDIGPDAVGSSELKAGAVAYSDQIIDDRIGSEHIAGDSVLGEHIADDAIGSEHLEADAVGSSAQVGDDVIHDEHILNAQVTEAKFAEHLEHGTITDVTAGGRYKTFGDAFGAMPHVVMTGVDANARLAQAPVVGSFKAELDAAGTAVVHFMAWGQRA